MPERELACPIEFIPRVGDLSKYRCACGWPDMACLKMHPDLRPVPDYVISNATATDGPIHVLVLKSRYTSS